MSNSQGKSGTTHIYTISATEVWGPTGRLRWYLPARTSSQIAELQQEFISQLGNRRWETVPMIYGEDQA